MADRTCSVGGCAKAHFARGWCSMHYYRWRRTGDPFGVKSRATRSAGERLAGKYVVDADGCWLWTGATSSTGYGRLFVEGSCGYAHRVSYEHHVGPIPEGFTIDHLCRQPRCIRPDHLEPVTNAENIRRGAAVITACPQGHEYDAENTYLYWDRKGYPHRICRICNRENQRRWRENQKAS